ncbi:MAG TPA: STAS domain-containing protein [Actinocrinis sp.]
MQPSVWDAADGESGRARLTMSTRREAEAVIVTLVGELDFDSAEMLGELINTVFSEHAARVLVDCAGLEFCDSSGLNVLLRARLAARAAGVELALVGVPVALERVLDLTGTTTAFVRYAGVEEALAGRRGDDAQNGDGQASAEG